MTRLWYYNARFVWNGVTHATGPPLDIRGGYMFIALGAQLIALCGVKCFTYRARMVEGEVTCKRCLATKIYKEHRKDDKPSC